MTCTDSAWPVEPVLTNSYSAVAWLPPAYPDTAWMTPVTCWKTPCTPQKHPPARTMTSGSASPDGSSSTGAGTVGTPSGTVDCVVDARHPASRTVAANDTDAARLATETIPILVSVCQDMRLDRTALLVSGLGVLQIQHGRTT